MRRTTAFSGQDERENIFSKKKNLKYSTVLTNLLVLQHPRESLKPSAARLSIASCISLSSYFGAI